MSHLFSARRRDELEAERISRFDDNQLLLYAGPSFMGISERITALQRGTDCGFLMGTVVSGHLSSTIRIESSCSFADLALASQNPNTALGSMLSSLLLGLVPSGLELSSLEALPLGSYRCDEERDR